MALLQLALVEGTLEEPMMRRLLAEVGVDGEELSLYVAGGSGRFWELAPKYNEAAKQGCSVFGLTDLDDNPCPSGLIAERLSGPLHPRFVLRIQVRELESWLLADPKAWAGYLKVSEATVPKEPDALKDPKRALVNLARRCNKGSIRADIVPEPGTPRVVGPGYTTRISEFITKHWSPSRAAERSPSLKRALAALESFARSQ